MTINPDREAAVGEAPYCGRHPRYLRNGRCVDCDAEIADAVREATEILRAQLAEVTRKLATSADHLAIAKATMMLAKSALLFDDEEHALEKDEAAVRAIDDYLALEGGSGLSSEGVIGPL